MWRGLTFGERRRGQRACARHVPRPYLTHSQMLQAGLAPPVACNEDN